MVPVPCVLSIQLTVPAISHTTALLDQSTLTDMKTNASTQQQLINALKGQTFQVPDIRTLFAEWPVKVNPLYESLACEVTGMIRR